MKKNKILAIAVFLVTMLFGTLDVNAATTYAEKLPDTVTRGPITYAYTTGTNATEGKSNYPFYNEDTTGTYLLYCSDRNNPKYEHNDVLKKSSERLPYGYVTILKGTYEFSPVNAYLFEQNVQNQEYTDKEQMKKMINTWITQMALWGYQGTITGDEINTNRLDYKAKDIGDINLAKKTIMLFTTNNKGEEVDLAAKNVWNSRVESVIQKAKTAKDPANSKLNVVSEGKTTWTESDNIAKSNLIKVESENGVEAKLSKFSVSLENAPEGTKVYTEDGKEVTDTTSITGGTKLYITIDKSKLDKSKEYNFKLNATGTITYDSAYMYTNDSGKQPSILVGPETKDIQGSLDFQIVPDTASSLSKSIYYIGFIILLCGVGMIYANVRPKRQEEE